MTSRIMFTITGPSCAGKTTLLNELLTRHSDQFVRLTSDTTRAPRAGEVDGEEYCFVDEETFATRALQGGYCQTVLYKGVRYGTRIDAMKEAFASGKTPIRVVEPTGIAQFRDVCEQMGATLFAIYVQEEAHILMARWLKRYRLDMNPDVDYYAGRILTTLYREMEWFKAESYDFQYDAAIMDEGEAIYALSRIGTGNMAWGTARKISPMKVEEGA